jgi:hypothetical protein
MLWNGAAKAVISRSPCEDFEPEPRELCRQKGVTVPIEKEREERFVGTALKMDVISKF